MIVKSIVLTSLAAVVASLSLRTDDDPDRYSFCYADRGFTKPDAALAADFVINNVTRVNGLFLAEKECVYNRANTTVVSLCNGSGRNRTVTQGEVRRGINQLFEDCGAGGSFNGVHVVNNLTFAAYGIHAGKNVAVPEGSPPPDLPGRLARLARQSVPPADDDDCNLGVTGESHTDCPRPEGHTALADGSCPAPITHENGCQVYCEVRRAGFLGLETRAPDEWGELTAAGTLRNLESGHETSISSGFSIGVDGVFKDSIGAGVSYQFSVTETTVKSVQIQMDDPPKTDYYRWVFFPRLVETCGSISRRKYKAGYTCDGTPGCVSYEPSCEGDVETLENICGLTPLLNKNKTPQVIWAVRREDANGVAFPLDQQHVSYQNVCNSRDPDGDGELECGNELPAERLL